ncbi:MAG: hypothetical protein RIQ33_1528 [Bacteroidota bacterium]|jgi:hypothetical protein
MQLIIKKIINVMKKIILLFALLITTVFYSSAQTITWADDVACIVYTHCTRCHNNTPNSIAALSFVSYNDMYSQRHAIDLYIDNGNMPPFLTSNKHHRFVDEKSLTQKEIDLIHQWVKQGCVQGNVANAPTPPVIALPQPTFSAPDISVRVPNFTVPITTTENFRQCFILTNPSTAVKYLSAIEVVPNTLRAIYSVYVYADTSSIPVAKDSADTSLGFENFGSISPSAKPLFGWMNGSLPYYYPTSFGLQIDSGSRIIAQVDYAEDAGGKVDSTLINLQFSPVLRAIESKLILSHNNNLIHPPFLVKADSVQTISESYTVNTDQSFYGVMPMLHYLCTQLNVIAVSPLNDTTNLADIPYWGAIWSQGYFMYNQPIHIKAGSTIYATATFDNTYLNNNNPNNPPQNITGGSTADDEEMLFYFQLSSYAIGDETTVMLDSTPHLAHYLNCQATHTPSGVEEIQNNEINIFPNPCNEELRIAIDELRLKNSGVEIYDLVGRKVLTLLNQKSEIINVSALPAGIYLLKIISDKKTFTQKFTKQ